MEGLREAHYDLRGAKEFSLDNRTVIECVNADISNIYLNGSTVCFNSSFELFKSQTRQQGHLRIIFDQNMMIEMFELSIYKGENRNPHATVQSMRCLEIGEIFGYMSALIDACILNDIGPKGELCHVHPDELADLGCRCLVAICSETGLFLGHAISTY